MIDLHTEEVLSLAEAARTLPKLASSGKPVSPATVWRWCFRGLRSGAVKLETAKIGGRTVTSREALARFFCALQPEAAAKALSRTPGQRQRASERAAEGLDRLGI